MRSEMPCKVLNWSKTWRLALRHMNPWIDAN